MKAMDKIQFLKINGGQPAAPKDARKEVPSKPKSN
jgi:hypothetical protein